MGYSQPLDHYFHHDRGACRWISAFYKLGRAEDPPFTFRTMVVRAIWPGANMDDTIKQVTERLERTLQEVQNLDNLRSFTRAGETTIFVDLKGSTQGREVSDTWYRGA